MKRVLFTLLATAAVVGCSKVDEGFDDMGVEMDVVAFSSQGIETRTTTDNKWVAGDAIGIYSDGFDTDYSNVKYTAQKAGATTTFSVAKADEQIKYPSTTLDEVSFYAYYPYSDTAKADGGAITIDIAEQFDKGMASVDFITAKVEDREYGVGKNDKAVDFLFTHALSKVVMKIECADDITSFEGLTVEISKIETKGEYDYKGALLAGGAGLTEAESLDLDVVLSGDKKSATVTLILHPGVYTTPTVIFTLGEREFTAAFATTLTATKSHTFNLKLGNDLTGMEVGSVIEPWGEGGNEAISPDEEVVDIVYNMGLDRYEINTAEGLKIFASLVNGEAYSGDGVMLGGSEENFDFSTMNLDIDAKLINNIDLEGSVDDQWTPIGTYSYSTRPDVLGVYNYYTGTFDGNSKTISGLYIDFENTSNSNYLGLFGGISGATIKGVTVDGYIETDFAGGIVGYAASGSVIDCHNRCDMVTTDSGSAGRLGGIIGEASMGEGDNNIILNCSNSGSITYEPTVDGFLWVSGVRYGGIVGYYGGSADSSLTIANCYNSGKLSDYYDINDYSYLGGIIGYVADDYEDLLITNCYNVGEFVESTKPSRVGGIVGRNDSSGNVMKVSYCYCSDATDLVYSMNPESPYANVGSSTMSLSDMKASSFVTTMNSGAYLYNYGATSSVAAYGWSAVSNGYPKLNKSVTPAFTTMVDDIVYNATSSTYEIKTADGLRAFSDLVNSARGNGNTTGLTLDPAYFDFSTTTDNTAIKGQLMADIDLEGEEWSPIGYDSYGTERFSGSFDGGGFTIEGLTITNSEWASHSGLFGYAIGATIENISLSGVDILNYSYIGGIVGYLYGGTISNCHIISGSVKGDDIDYVGGIVGYVQGDVTIINCSNGADVTDYKIAGGIVGSISSIANLTLANCYNSGRVTSSNDCCGGIVGIFAYSSGYSSTITNCYSSGVASGSSNLTGGIVGYSGASSYPTALTLTNCYCDEANSVVGSSSTSNYTNDGSSTMEADAMKAITFGETLTTTAATITGAYKWAQVAGSYPTLTTTLAKPQE